MNIKDLPQSTGIYKLTNILNGKIYIGKTVNLRKRIKEHRFARNKSQPICQAIRKYGWDNFTVEILAENIHLEELLSLETAFIEYFNATDRRTGYNLCLFGESKLGVVCSETTKSRISETLKKNKSSYLNGKTGILHPNFNKKQSKEQIKQRISKVVKVFKVISPENKIIIVENLHEFCKQNNLSSGSMSSVANGHRKHYKGWKVEHATSI